MIHPSLIEKISLDAREGNRAVIDDLKRSYPYVGPVTVTTHAATDPACNVMKLIVRMSKPYWTADEQGTAMWEAVSSWLDGKMYKVGSTMANFNKSRAEKDQQTVTFGRLELDMKPYLFGIMLAGDDTLPEAEDLVGRFRELVNAGVIEGVVARGELTSAACWAAQYAAAEEAAPAAVAAEAEAAEGAVVAEGVEVVEPAAAAEGMEALGVEEAAGAEGEGVAEGGEEAAAETGEPVAGEASAAEEPAAAPKVVVPNVSYGIWDVVFADGSVRQLDSVAGAWL